MVVMQDEEWRIGEELGHGRNGQVHAAVNPHYPNTVLKRTYAAAAEQEADKLWRLCHPNIVRLHAFLETTDVLHDGQPAAYLVLDRLGRSIASALCNPLNR